MLTTILLTAAVALGQCGGGGCARPGFGGFGWGPRPSYSAYAPPLAASYYAPLGYAYAPPAQGFAPPGGDEWRTFTENPAYEVYGREIAGVFRYTASRRR